MSQTPVAEETEDVRDRRTVTWQIACARGEADRVRGGDTGACEKNTFEASIRIAIPQQKLLYRPWPDALTADLPKYVFLHIFPRLLFLRIVFSDTGRKMGKGAGKGGTGAAKLFSKNNNRNCPRDPREQVPRRANGAVPTCCCSSAPQPAPRGKARMGLSAAFPRDHERSSFLVAGQCTDA